MLTSGLVSLNVHEALAFDGTEICLHPDLFLPPGTHSDLGSSIQSLSAGMGNNNNTKDPRLSLNSSGSQDESAPPPPQNEKLLKAGDFIEVRVWDPHRAGRAGDSTTTAGGTASARILSNAASIIRKRATATLSTPPPQQPSGNTTPSALSSPPSPSPEQTGPHDPTSEKTEAAALSTDQIDHPANQSMQYSDSDQSLPNNDRASCASPPAKTDGSSVSSRDATALRRSPHDTHSNSNSASNLSGNSSSNPLSVHMEPPIAETLVEDVATPPAKSVITGGIPPVFPRARTSTADGVRPPQLASTKPPVHRRSNSSSDPITNNASKPRGIQSTSGSNLINSKPPSLSRHVREISDMTADTVYAPDHRGTGATDLQLQPLVNNFTCSDDGLEDEDDDDLWTILSTTHTLRLSFVMLVTEKSLTSLKGNARAQVSILRRVADLYELSSYDMVTIGKIDKRDEPMVLDTVSADFITLTIKDQFISRGDMHVFQQSLIGSWIYEGKRLLEQTRSIQAHAQEIRHGDHQARSGIVTDKTTITFRSRSARFIWLVQMSSEMWDYSSPYEKDDASSRCEIYFDKLISFLHRLFHKWKKLENTHALTVVFFSRTFVGTGPGLFVPGEAQTRVQRDAYGRRSEDHFRIIIENEVSSDWESLVLRFKEAFIQYPLEVGWNLKSGDDARRPSLASQGNVLEAINVTLNLLQFHYLDRDLHRTGNSLVVISAGSGVFEVDKGLAGITYQRMMDNGIGSDMVSLGLPPLHISPFFLYVNLYQQVGTDGVDTAETYYEVPHWMNLCFVSYDDSESSDDKPEKAAAFKEKSQLVNPAGLCVAPNGFLLQRPNVEAESGKAASPSLRPKTFSAQGNAASSPKKQSIFTQERQLIAGRDFRDILEACRPRNTSMLPSALQAFISMYESTDAKISHDEEVNDDSPAPTEWGSIDSRALQNSESGLSRTRGLSLGQESDSHSPMLAPALSPPTFSPPRVDELGGIETCSQSSSFASQISSYLLGVSFDRPFVSTQSQMQRCPSLELETLDTDGSLSSSPGHVGRLLSDQESEEDTQKYLDHLRKIMKAHDEEAPTKTMSSPLLVPQSETTPAADPSSSRHSAKTLGLSPGLGTLSQQRLPSGTGGIGAALSHYRSSSSNSTRLIRGDVEVDGKTIQRISSSSGVSNLQRGFRQLSEMTPRGLSPLFLPPVTASTPDPSDLLGWRSLEPRGALPREASSSSGPLLMSTSSVGDHIGQHERKFPPAGSLFSSSPPAGTRFFNSSIRKDRFGAQRAMTRESSGRSKANQGSRRKKAFNPFRQQDEDEVLAKNSHNRRRWSHVFALGEVEFRRRTGPNWKSLTAPAILPLYVGYFPTQSEVDHGFTFSINNITLKEFDRTYYSSNKELLMEMVRQRLTQDFQVVPPSHVNASNLRRETLRDGLANRGRSSDIAQESPDLMRQFLSMGHRLQVLTYDPESDIIEVTRYDAKSAQGTASETVKYHYLCYCEETKQYRRVVQTFRKYNNPYNWNKFDRIVCGDTDREMREGMRFRRIMFALIPPNFGDDIAAEQEYIAKFLRLLEYLNKLRDKEDKDAQALNVKIVSTSDVKGQFSSTPGIARNSMQRFYVELRKRKRDPIEWMEVVVDSTFNTSWSYRIMLHWLVASSAKVDTQVQLLQRRCTQYGLDLKPFPQSTVSRNAFLNPFKSPHFFVLKSKEASDKLDENLSEMGFIHDGVFSTDIKSILECIEPMDFDLGGRRWATSVLGRQFVHRSGTLFVRLLPDQKGRTIVLTIGNYLFTNQDTKAKVVAKNVFQDLAQCIEGLQSAQEQEG